MFSLTNLIRGRTKPPKRCKTSNLKPIVFVKLNTRGAGKPKPVTIKALLDSGGAGTLVTTKCAKKLKLKQLKCKQEWITPAGKMETNYKAKAQFVIPELHDNRLIEWDVHVTKDLGIYDMIIGRDVLKDLGIDIRFSTETVEWDQSQIPFRNIDDDPHTSYYIRDSDTIDEATERLKSILDAKYEAADLEEIAANSEHLTEDEQMKLRNLLTKHASLFDGTLGNWQGEELEVELKDDAKPYHAKAFPIPKVHMETLKLEVDRLVKLGVLKRVNRSEWAAPTFIIPKKDGTVRFISDFRELNKRI